jgi:MSHA pilin protein MshC
MHTKAIRRGFTLVELVVSISIIGILATVAVTRFMGTNTYSSRGFYDRAISVVRHAQKVAIAQRRDVFVVVTADRIAVCYDDILCGNHVSLSSEFGFVPSMGSELSKCASDKTWLCAGAPDSVTLSTATFKFDGLGRPDVAVSIAFTSGVAGDPARKIWVEAETGYVHP